METNFFFKVISFLFSLIKGTLRLIVLFLYVLTGGDLRELSKTPEQLQADAARKAIDRRKQKEIEAKQSRQEWVSADDDDEDEHARKRRRSDDFIAHPNPLSNHHQVHISMSHDHHLDSGGMSSGGMSSGGMGGSGMGMF